MYRLTKTLASKTWLILWMIWSVVITSTLIIALIAFAIYEWRSRRALDPDRVHLMPAPTIVAQGVVDPFRAIAARDVSDGIEIFYATDRLPSADEDEYYENERGYHLRVGLGHVAIDESITSWEQLLSISREASREDDFQIRVDDTDEFGVLTSSLTLFDPVEATGDEGLTDPEERFRDGINRQLKRSGAKDVYIYVHGYKVVFENPLLVASELWHYMGYRGAMVAFSWPSTPHVLAYLADRETTKTSARSLRVLVEFLAKETEAERIHILGYSAGTGLVLSTLDQMALLDHDSTGEAIQERYRLKNVILVCSDVDRGVFANQLNNGIWRTTEHLIIYASEADETLGMSQLVFGRKPLGRLFGEEEDIGHLKDLLDDTMQVAFIDVTGAENVGANNGHAYFHKSPWVSSDLLLTLASGLPPEERGLVRKNDNILWEFPSDYPERLDALKPMLNPAE